MKRFLALAAVAAAAAAGAPAAAVTYNSYNVDFTNGVAIIGQIRTDEGEYQDTYLFHTDSALSFSGSLSTQRLRAPSPDGGATLGDIVSDLDFGNSLPGDGVYLDGIQFALPTGGQDTLEVQNIGSTLLAAGDHTLVVNYTVQAADAVNGAAYAGPISLAVADVPEPSAWAMFLAGFGLIGAGLRRKQRVTFASL